MLLQQDNATARLFQWAVEYKTMSELISTLGALSKFIVKPLPFKILSFV